MNAEPGWRSARTAASFLATPPVKVNSSWTPPERASSESARRMTARCRPARMSSRFWPSARRSRISAPAKTVQVELMRTGLQLCCASGPSSCRPRFISSAM